MADDPQVIEQLVKALQPQMESERFKYDAASVRDVIRIVRGVEATEGRNEALRPERLAD